MLSTTAGDLLPGATLACHPELFRAIASTDPVFDLLVPYLPPPNASRNGVSFRAVDPKPTRDLLLVFQYHYVAPKGAFPAVLLVTSQASGIDSLQARKAGALLGASSASGRPVLLQSAHTAGRSGFQGLALRQQLTADLAAFLWTETAEK